MLKIQNLNVYYDAIHALTDINIEVKEGEIVTLIGANGAGKTSTLRAISGLVPAKSGTITFEDKKLNGYPAYKIPYLGISHVPEGRRIFSNLTVMENLQLGAYCRKDDAGIKKDFEMVYAKFPRLKERMKQRGGTLSGGEQQMLAMGRALMARPKILLLDEPSMGLAPIIVQEIFHIIKEINGSGTTILLVEQNANMALSIANRAYVIETGNIVLEGKASDLLQDDSVKQAYLGG
ncbi:ABC transporter ATP-binding protein [Clostridium sp. W14A]|uniref:ABC transporter ATP-binding protein n=1 Tax=Caproicibacter fermentans TaxID=2576756 RepID=A0A7G8TB18_9FIRM|nr:ABC transporter ATP-binding protein [Caproicibacter fermentans]OCN00516.1 ABC transporter ATP-binding protein [Clostridium sp. W14A]QNK40809.1 ABC transporter ATP-binding protein [Caproicibacter fermentans]